MRIILGLAALLLLTLLVTQALCVAPLNVQLPTGLFRVEFDPSQYGGSCFSWIERYQTLIASIIALIGAGFGALAIYRQIGQTAEIEAARREGKREAARAILPLSLSAICGYAEDCSRILHELNDKCVGGILPDTVVLPTFPDVPNQVIDSFKEMVEFLGVGERDAIFKLASRVQIQRARIDGIARSQKYEGSFITDTNLCAYILDCAEIYARASKIFKYARGEDSEFPDAELTRENYSNSLSSFRIFDDLADELLLLKFGPQPE